MCSARPVFRNRRANESTEAGSTRSSSSTSTREISATEPRAFSGVRAAMVNHMVNNTLYGSQLPVIIILCVCVIYISAHKICARSSIVERTWLKLLQLLSGSAVAFRTLIFQGCNPSEPAIYTGSYTSVTKERQDTGTTLDTVNLDERSAFRTQSHILKGGWL